MSGVISPNMLTIEMQNLDSSAGNYKMVTFPNRVRITSLGFTVNQECMGNLVDERSWQMYCLVGHPTPTEGDQWAENIHPIFGLNEKPTVTYLRKYTSDFAQNTPNIVVIPNTYYETIAIDYGIIEPGAYLVVWVQNDGGDIDDIVWDNTAASIFIGYEETTAPSANEVIAKYPSLD